MLLFFWIKWNKVSLWSEMRELPAYWQRQRSAQVIIPPSFRISTGPHSRQYVLAFPPSKLIRKTAVIYIHGGGWQFGRPEYFGLQGAAFSEWGFPTFMISHRKLPFFGWQDMLEDVDQAVRQVFSVLKSQYPEVNQIILGGMSSGGHLAALYASTIPTSTLWADGPQLQGVFMLGAPLDLNSLKVTPPVHVLTRKTGLPAANPLDRWNSNPPTQNLMILHGHLDGMVPISGTQRFVDRISSSTSNLTFPDLPLDTHISVASWSQPASPHRFFVRDWLEEVSAS